ncbi:MAG: hypothetical protein A2352_02375 [Caulobacterales bacterium RIFOXYB1_FULL_67_16]|nr:MAG: hypothetical protein A2352_02375 [Caulobacterales bacterium RIFOXYB1_FULL_67_16]
MSEGDGLATVAAMTDALSARADLFLLEPGFEDPAFPGAVYFDRYSALLEGVLRSYPRLEEVIVVHRVGFERTRGLTLAVREGEAPGRNAVVFRRDDRPTDGYGLTVTDRGATVTAGGFGGLLYGAVSLPRRP